MSLKTMIGYNEVLKKQMDSGEKRLGCAADGPASQSFLFDIRPQKPSEKSVYCYYTQLGTQKGGMNLEKEKHIVRLVMNKAVLPEEPEGMLRFGPAGCFGIHTLQVEAGEGWEGRVITATFYNNRDTCVEALLCDGVITVPAEATEYATGDTLGTITFVGVDDSSCRVSCKLPYYVEESVCVRGRTPAPSPDKWQQFVDEVKQAAVTGGYKIGTGLTVDEETNTLSVDAAEAVEENNTKPVTSAAVYTQLGNVEALLHSI